MRIYGQSFNAIYRAMPWHFRAMVVISIAFLLFICVFFARIALHGTYLAGRAEPLVFLSQGIYNGTDPALASDGQDNTLLAYTSIAQFKTDITLAQARDGACTQWAHLPGANPLFSGATDSLIAPDGITTIGSGVWRYETAAIVFDPGDATRAWKVYAYKYFWTRDQNIAAARRYGMIVLRAATSPSGPWSPEVPAFLSAPDYPPAPYADASATTLSTLDPSLKDVTLFTRPSVVEAGGILLMSLSAFGDEQMTPDRVVLIASTNNGYTWRYLGTPLTRADAKELGHDTLNGASLVKKGSRIFLSAVFGNKDAMADGTLIFRFEDIAKGLLARDDGKPEIVNEVPRSSERPSALGGGYAAYTDACPMMGLMTGENSGLTGRFHLFKTKIDPEG